MLIKYCFAIIYVAIFCINYLYINKRKFSDKILKDILNNQIELILDWIINHSNQMLDKNVFI